MKWHSAQVPFCKGTKFDKFNYVKPKLFGASLGKPPPKESWQIKKVDGPAVGTYDIQSAIQKTQFRRLVNTPKSTAKNQCFVDIYKKKKE